MGRPPSYNDRILKTWVDHPPLPLGKTADEAVGLPAPQLHQLFQLMAETLSGSANPEEV
jgi:hypothetical protein